MKKRIGLKKAKKKKKTLSWVGTEMSGEGTPVKTNSTPLHSLAPHIVPRARGISIGSARQAAMHGLSVNATSPLRPSDQSSTLAMNNSNSTTNNKNDDSSRGAGGGGGAGLLTNSEHSILAAGAVLPLSSSSTATSSTNKSWMTSSPTMSFAATQSVAVPGRLGLRPRASSLSGATSKLTPKQQAHLLSVTIISCAFCCSTLS
jgi:hypothetical protein